MKRWIVGLAVLSMATGAFAAGERIIVSDLKVELKEEPFGAVKGSKYLKLTFNANFKEKAETSTNLKTRATCQVNKAPVTYEILANSVKLDTVEAGKTVEMPVSLFKAKEKYLTAKPESCEIVITYGGVTAKADKRTSIATYCWSGGAAKEGACAVAPAAPATPVPAPK
jgi:hypothetical protein